MLRASNRTAGSPSLKALIELKFVGSEKEAKRAFSGVLEDMSGYGGSNETIGKSQLPDRRFRDLVQHFNKHRLRNEDFEFPDLLGEVAEPGQYTRRGLADGEGSPVRRYCARTAATTIEAVAGRATGLEQRAQIHGEGRVGERAAIEPGLEASQRPGVGAARVL